MTHDNSAPISWLLLRDGHAVPLTGLSPEALKTSRGETIERDNVVLKNTSGLNAIVHCLGFDGDFGDYKTTHWPHVQRLMANRGLREYRNLFDVPINDLTFGLMKDRRRALADRIFFGPTPLPRRVFLGYGHDWESWDRLFDFVDLSGWGPRDDVFVPTELEKTRRWVYRHRSDLFGNIDFFSDHLLDLGHPGTIEPAVYFLNIVGVVERLQTIARIRKVLEAFRWFIERRSDGWIELVPVTDRLVLLAGPQGSFDLLWANLREAPPPKRAEGTGWLKLHPMDLPSSLVAEKDFVSWNYYRLGAWDEKERHESEGHYYAQGGQAQPQYPGSDVILRQYLQAMARYGNGPRLPGGSTAPPGFQPVRLGDGRQLFISDLVTIAEFRQFADETSYMERREGENWSAANDDNPGSTPVAGTLRDALAYCAWKERKLGVAVRLFTVEEHRELRPFASAHYQRLANLDFPWENWPPRAGLQASVLWSEPRFLDPGPDLPEFPKPSGVGGRSRKRWIVQENWPPHARWCDSLPWAEHAGIRFIDAWDAYEWCANARIAGRYWEGLLGIESWGEYKNIKVGFRIVIDQDVP